MAWASGIERPTSKSEWNEAETFERGDVPIRRWTLGIRYSMFIILSGIGRAECFGEYLGGF
jgi:hypothetical protein